MNQTKIEATISDWLQQKMVPGVTLGVLENHQKTARFYGVMGSLPPFSQQSLSAANVYDLASLTKVIGTTTRILQLIDAGKLTFSTTIAELLPDYSFLDVTIEALLLHQSGLPADLPDKQNVSKDKIRQYLLTCSSLATKATVYSDLGYFLLGEVISQLDQCSLAASFQQNIFGPMGMTGTGYQVFYKEKAVPTEVTKARGIIQGVVHDSKAFQLKESCGSAGLFSTVTDLLTFADCFINNRLPNGADLFSKPLVEKLWTTDVNGRTYGWEIKVDQHQDSYLFHTGFTGTSIGLKLASKEALILLTNRIHPNRQERGFLKARTELYQLYF